MFLFLRMMIICLWARCKKRKKNIFFTFLKSMKPDPDQNVMDPQHWFEHTILRWAACFFGVVTDPCKDQMDLPGGLQSRSGRPKNMWIRWIRIRNTDGRVVHNKRGPEILTNFSYLMSNNNFYHCIESPFKICF